MTAQERRRRRLTAPRVHNVPGVRLTRSKSAGGVPVDLTRSWRDVRGRAERDAFFITAFRHPPSVPERAP